LSWHFILINEKSDQCTLKEDGMGQVWPNLEEEEDDDDEKFFRVF
jgi:hypothetical protein